MRFIWIILVTFLLSSCSIVDACFNSHLASQGKKYNSYGKSRSGAKSYSAKKPKRATHGKMAFASEKRVASKKAVVTKDGATTLSAVASTKSTQRVVYSKKELKEIRKENRRLHKKSKKGKGKFRYSYDIPSPYKR